MLSPDAVKLVIDQLNALGWPYMITGSIASSAYGEPRATQDADFVVQTQQQDMQQIFERLRQEFDHEPQMSFETVTGTTQHKFRFRRTLFLIEIFEADFNDPHERARFERRIEVELLDRRTWFPTAEDVIIQKLRWFVRIRRAKDLEDTRQVMFHQWPHLDWPYIERWCREHDSDALLTELRTEVQTMLDDEV